MHTSKQNKRLKIVHCIFTMETGGSQILVVDLINEMCLNHDVSLVIVNNTYNQSLLNTINSKVKIHYVNRPTGSKSILPLLKLNILLRQLKPDAIHCHESRMGLVLKFIKKKLAYTIHDVGIPTFTFKKYNRLIAISKAVETDVTSRSEYKPRIINNGVSYQLFSKRTNYITTETEPIRLVQISRLMHEKKGQDLLIRALKKLKTEHPAVNIQLDFLGEGKSEQFLKDLTNELELTENISFLGDKSREWLHKHICDYHMLVQPSRYEGFGLTIVEAMAAGLPILASDIDGPLEILSKTTSGFLFKSDDVDDLARKLFHCYNIYRNNEMDQIMKQAKNLAEGEYSATECANKYLEEYALL